MAPVPFAGALAPKKKSELQDIANALDLADQGTKEELQTRIKKHLDAHPSLEDDPQFAGLFGRRKRSTPAPASTRLSEKPRSSLRTAAAAPVIVPLEPVREASPAHDLRDISAPQASSPLATPQQSPLRHHLGLSPDVHEQDEAILMPQQPVPQPSPAKSIIEAIPRAAEISAAVRKFHKEEIVPSGTEYLEATRAFLSNSQNIWTLTALFELLHILSAVIPFEVLDIPLASKADGSPLISIPYPPLATFQTAAFWLVLLHWAVPALIAPAFVGNLISFTPPPPAPLHSAPSATPPRTATTPPPAANFDPLTAAIIRLAASIAYPYDLLADKAQIKGLDVLGYNWRVFNASVGLAFAFAEAIFAAPKAAAAASQSKPRSSHGKNVFLVTDGEKESEEVD